ncbi:MAG: helix-turn-helix transcriptional regulator [Erysipelotrichaceae bacterium]|nr:helix-turn-helix transcriptional regulator [Erysipelotrichaceae bacterium]
MNQERIGAFIQQMRKEKEMTQEQLASKLGTSQRSISRRENGKTMPDYSMYEPLCEALGIQVSELLYGKRMTDTEKTVYGETSALNLFTAKSELETFGILAEILIVAGIIISMTLTGMLAETFPEMIATLVSGWFVWGFGLLLRVKIRKAVTKPEQN